MKKIGLFLVSVALSLNLGLVSTFAGQSSQIKIAIDNQVLNSEQEPIIINGRTMVPVRFVSEELDYQVKWDNVNKNVYIYDQGVTPQTFTGSTKEINVYLNNKQIIFPDQKPVIIKGTTLIPLKAVADNMDVKVSWNGDQKLVNIYTNDANSNTTATQPTSNTNSNKFAGYTTLEVYGGDLSGTRQPNVVVDIGFGDREYYGFTNEYGQLVKVTADKIILQDDSKEPVYSTGRYYADEAKVPGTELADYDEGHVIADSLGGVSNAYNITPQQSVLNRNGDQAYMEKNIRDAGGATNFVAIITYPNTQTQTPSHYSYTYTLNGNIIHDEFDNVNPDKVNSAIIEEQKETSTKTSTNTATVNVKIIALDKKAEVITIKNNSSTPVDLTGFVIVSVRGDQRFTFPSFTLQPDASVRVGDSATNKNIDFHWLDGNGTWNNSDMDPAELYDSNGNLISTYN